MPYSPPLRAVLAFAFILPSALALDICAKIQRAVSSASDVYYPTDLLGRYTADISHWATSSTQEAACTVEPGTAADVSAIIRLVGATKTPFAVKGGGHTSNPGFSSTTGVQISMNRFSEVTYDAAKGTATIGAGLFWDDVYAALEPFGVNVVGGRVSGVGVAGFTLGGGYSWKTNQFGLTVDNVVAYELVKPNGHIVNVTASSEPDLFFGLKGGLNNFGVVTKFTLKTFPQGQVWGGVITYVEHFSDVGAAIERFSATVTDPKAAMIPACNFLLSQACPPGLSNFISLILFYDGPTPPAGIFDDFLAIPNLSEDIKTRSFLSLVNSPGDPATGRAAFHTVSVLAYSPTLVDAILNETSFWAAQLTSAGASFISYDIEPFLPTIYTHNKLPTAYPPVRGPGYMPLNLYFSWANETSDEIFHAALKQSAAHLTQVAINDGQHIAGAPLYTNYALADTPLERIYGAHLLRLRAIKRAVDPGNVMGLAGGFKF
ncbi:FAD dependent oxidoreductase [Mycena vulgaris]|nr:FAD dependent oxidoreductase [Mycena vulgaris]